MEGVDSGLGELCLLAIQPSGSGAGLFYRASLNGLVSALWRLTRVLCLPSPFPVRHAIG
jgi:hypothetical protein